LTLEEYQQMFAEAMTLIHTQWEKRRRKAASPES
jgi:hypothetical protein